MSFTSYTKDNSKRIVPVRKSYYVPDEHKALLLEDAEMQLAAEKIALDIAKQNFEKEKKSTEKLTKTKVSKKVSSSELLNKLKEEE